MIHAYIENVLVIPLRNLHVITSVSVWPITAINTTSFTNTSTLHLIWYLLSTLYIKFPLYWISLLLWSNTSHGICLEAFCYKDFQDCTLVLVIDSWTQYCLFWPTKSCNGWSFAIAICFMLQYISASMWQENSIGIDQISVDVGE